MTYLLKIVTFDFLKHLCIFKNLLLGAVMKFSWSFHRYVLKCLFFIFFLFVMCMYISDVIYHN